MANQINWGQAANNNNISFGQGAFNSTNDWGFIYQFSSSGEIDLKKKIIAFTIDIINYTVDTIQITIDKIYQWLNR